jgi:peroxiredoxin
MDTVIFCGDPAPLFSLADLDGSVYKLEEQRGRVVVLNFWSAECPWSERADRDLVESMAAWGEAVTVWTIAANANEAPALLQQEAAQRGVTLLLHDGEQQVVDLYGAQTTPHLFVIDAHGILRYQGALDDVTFRKRTPSVNYVRQAVEALLAGKLPDPEQTPPYGCTIVRDFQSGAG